MWPAIIVTVAVAGLWIMAWMYHRLDEVDGLTFDRKMAAVKRAVEEARRNQ